MPFVDDPRLGRVHLSMGDANSPWCEDCLAAGRMTDVGDEGILCDAPAMVWQKQPAGLNAKIKFYEERVESDTETCDRLSCRSCAVETGEDRHLCKRCWSREHHRERQRFYARREHAWAVRVGLHRLPGDGWVYLGWGEVQHKVTPKGRSLCGRELVAGWTREPDRPRCKRCEPEPESPSHLRLL